MKRHFVVIALVCVAGGLGSPFAAAQDTVYTKEKKEKGIKGTIEKEQTRGVKTSGAKALVPAEDIIDIAYEVKPLGIRLSAYRPAIESDKEAIKAIDGKRHAPAEDAIKKYEKALAGLEAGQTFALRNIEFRIAYMRALQAQDDPKNSAARETAIAKLTEFKTKHPNTWQLGRVLKTLAELQMVQKDYAGAEQSYRELGDADIDEATKEESQLLSAVVPIQAGKYDAAEKNLRALIGKLSAGSRQSQRAQIALGEALTANKQMAKDARDVLTKVIAETKDRDVKAMAYNALGCCSFANEQLQDARWDFLWVDVVYNQDKAEHAKALYYLWQIFDRLNENDRANECFQTLTTDPDFAGTEFQRRAERERPKAQ